MEMTGAAATSCMRQTLPEPGAESVEHASPAALDAGCMVGGHVLVCDSQLAARPDRNDLCDDTGDYRAVSEGKRKYQTPMRNDLDVLAPVLRPGIACPLAQPKLA